MILVETIPGIGGRGIKEEVEGLNSSLMYLIHCEILCKCHNVPIQHNNKEKIKVHLISILMLLLIFYFTFDYITFFPCPLYFCKEV
jgi:hypothetical protein